MQITGRKFLGAVAAAALLVGTGSAFAYGAAGDAASAQADAAAAAGVKAGIDAWQAGDYTGAVRIWRPLADQGSGDAQFNLGQAYRLGRGVPADLRTAQSWFEKAAQQGHAQAQANLGLILHQNGERQRAMPWIRKAAEAGDPRAQYVLGTELFNGDLLPKDWPRAYALMQLSAGQGMPFAVSNLQQMDKLIPLQQRQQGLALSREMQGKTPARPPQAAGAVGRANVPPSNSALQSTLPAPSRTPAAPVRTAQAPKPAPAAQPRPAPAATGRGWRIQLGAFSSQANARKQWEGLRSRVGGLASLQPSLVSAGAVTRLQAGPLPSRAAADRVCAAAKQAGAACFPVAP
jgi:uncharacterized protein